MSMGCDHFSPNGHVNQDMSNIYFLFIDLGLNELIYKLLVSHLFVFVSVSVSVSYPSYVTWVQHFPNEEKCA